MKDREFKDLKHFAKDFKFYLNGQELMNGYKPDLVLKKEEEYIILESEVSTSRKGYIGGMVKAAKFLSHEKRGILIYVIELKKNATPSQISKHLEQYLYWIKELTNLKDVYIISDIDYCTESTPIEILSTEFINKSVKVLPCI